jgi:hypothetical protein
VILQSITADPGATWYCDDYIYSVIRSVGLQYGVPWQLLLAVAAYESGFNPSAIGGLGERGLFQIYPDQHPDFDMSRWEDPTYNTQYACGLMLQSYSGDWYAAIWAWTTRPKAWPLYQEWSSASPGGVNCVYCGAWFATQAELTQHIARVHGTSTTPMPGWVIPAGMVGAYLITRYI